jgi:hypothetical protein
MQLASEGRRCMYISKALKIATSHFAYRYLLTRIIVLDHAWMVSVGKKTLLDQLYLPNGLDGSPFGLNPSTAA